jgi:PIN domain nuclease of toxin-antitoxin system
VKVLVDTHCWLWALASPEALNTEAAALLSDGETEVVFSAVSVWEIAIKSALGKLRVSTIDSDSLFDILNINHSHGFRFCTPTLAMSQAFLRIMAIRSTGY